MARARVSARGVCALTDARASLPAGEPRLCSLGWRTAAGRGTGALLVSLLLLSSLPGKTARPQRAPPSRDRALCRGAPHLVLLEVGLQGHLGLSPRLQDSQDPQQDQSHPQRVQSGHCPGAECVTRACDASRAGRGREAAGGAEATGETPIYGPGLASTQGPRTAHWRLVMPDAVMLGADRALEASCSLAPRRAAYVRGSDHGLGSATCRSARAEAPVRLVLSPVPEMLPSSPDGGREHVSWHCLAWDL